MYENPAYYDHGSKESKKKEINTDLKHMESNSTVCVKTLQKRTCYERPSAPSITNSLNFTS